MGLILRTTTTPNSGNSLSIKGSALSHAEGDGNFMYLLTNMSGSSINITGSTNVLGAFTATGVTKFTGLANSAGTNLLIYNTTTGQLFYQTTSSLTVGTASIATSSSYAATASIATSSSYSLSSSYAATAVTSSYVTSLVQDVSLTGSLSINNTMKVSGSYIIQPQVSSSFNFANDTAAAAGGIPLGGLYRNGNAIQIRLV
jgi:hypothetical protein